MTTPAIELTSVTKRFREKVAVDHLDLVVPQGSVCGFLGPNGAGKTTTIRMIMSILFPNEGQISVLGKRSAVESKDRIGYLPEERGVYRKMKVGEFLTFMAKLKGADAHGLKKRIESELERIGLPDVWTKRNEELSKGMQQKVQFLATILHDPELIILDEPFSGLDPVNARLLRQLINELHDEGRTIIFSTHVLYSAEQLCDRVFMINKGRKVLDGSVDEIRAEFDPRTIVVEPMTGTADTEALAGMPEIDHVRQNTDNTLELTLAGGIDPQRAMGAIAQTNSMRRIELRRATLEDVFVHLVEPGDSEDILRAELSGAGAGGES
ncbi:MAG: ATP-binding cassette domain-containing protein [Phycisphaerales bacterium]